MNPYIKLGTIIGAGLIVGTLAGRFIFSDKGFMSKSAELTQNNDPRMIKRVIEESDKQVDEPENFFI